MGKRSSVATTFAAGGILFAVAASWLAVDPRPIDGFEAPKLLLLPAGLSVAAVAALASRLRRPPGPARDFSKAARAAVALFLAAVAGACAAALLSARPAQSLDSLRRIAVFLLAVPLGATEAFDRHRGKILAVFLSGAAVNAVLVLLAAFRIYTPLAVQGEFETAALGALIGNPGHLAIALSLAAVTALGLLVKTGRAARIAGGVLVLLSVAGMLATQTLTGLIAAGAGIVVFAAARSGRRAWPYLLAALVLASSMLLVRPVRWRLGRMAAAVREGDWNRVLTARGAPWLAAVEMIREHPIRGVGPGNFGAEFVPARLAAEARIHRHLVLPGMRTNSFTQAHNDYLDLAAAVGLPCAACLLAALALLLRRLWRRAREEPEAAAQTAILCSGAVAALAWFPFQLPTSALWLLLAAGRGFRVAEEEE